MNFDNNKLKIIIAALVAVLIILSVIVYVVSNRTPAPIQVDPETVQRDVQPIIEITEIPRVDDAKGGGINTDAPEVKISQQSLEKLRSQLPYYTSFTTADGIDVEVSIPPTETVSNDWTLLVHVFGPDYQIPENDPQYGVHRQAFLAGVADTLQFLKQHGIDRSEIIIQWGDRAIIGERSAQWLQD